MYCTPSLYIAHRGFPDENTPLSMALEIEILMSAIVSHKLWIIPWFTVLWCLCVWANRKCHSYYLYQPVAFAGKGNKIRNFEWASWLHPFKKHGVCIGMLHLLFCQFQPIDSTVPTMLSSRALNDGKTVIWLKVRLLEDLKWYKAKQIWQKSMNRSFDIERLILF